MLPYLLFIAGFVILIFGAELLIRGAARLATIWGISPVIVGLTIVAIGTSAPELAISTFSAARGQTDLAFGNIIGSNICNILLVLGASALFAPLVVSQKIIRIDVPIMIGFSVMTGVMAFNGLIGPVDGIILLGCALGYTVFTVIKSKPESKDIEKEYE